MAELSPAAQAVLDAAINAAESPDAEAIAAAALRAAACLRQRYLLLRLIAEAPVLESANDH